MPNRFWKIFDRPICLALGVILTLLATSANNFYKSFFERIEVQSMASFPYYHMARLYSSPGLGEQTLTLEVNGRIVWTTCAIGGDLEEKLIWDKSGHILSLELAGKKFFPTTLF